MRSLLLVLTSYCIGCVVGAYYIFRLRTGADVRTLGSGNAGARNVLRTLDKTGAAATLVFDAAKGALAVWLAHFFVQQDWAAGIAFLMVVIGHIWPVQLAFHGGKGAAPGLGCMLVIDPPAAFVALAGGALLFLVTRNVTAAGLTAVALAPALHALFGATWADAAAVATACTLILIAHHPAFDRRRVPATSVGGGVQGSRV